MQDPLDNLKQVISAPRFAEYARTASSDADAVGRYVWNTRLCEALYPSLNSLEIALRNRLHNAISERFAQGPWNDVNSWLDRTAPILEPEEVKEIQKAKRRLLAQLKPLDVGRVVAELNFGFWNSLLDVRYERSNTLWPHLLQRVFPGLPKTSRKRTTVSPRINKIRLLRNRVFHYEPVWHWRDLPRQHADLVEAVAWLEPDLALVTRHVDRFDEIFQRGWHTYRTGVLG